MPIDFDKMETKAAEPGYIDDVEAGNNTDLSKRFNADDPAKTAAARRTMNEVRDAIAPGVPDLSADKVAQVQFIIGDELDFASVNLDTALRRIFSGLPSEAEVLANIDAINKRQASVADQFGEQFVGLREMRELVKRPGLPTSAHNVLNGPAEQARKATNSDIIRRVGLKIDAVRTVAIASLEESARRDFINWRFAGAAHIAAGDDGQPIPASAYQAEGDWPPGGVYAQVSNRREEFVDQKMVEMGLDPARVI